MKSIAELELFLNVNNRVESIDFYSALKKRRSHTEYDFYNIVKIGAKSTGSIENRDLENSVFRFSDLGGLMFASGSKIQ